MLPKSLGNVFALTLAAGLLGAASLLAGRQAPRAAQAAPAGQAVPAKQSEPGKLHTEIPDTKGETCLGCHDGLDKAKVVHAPVAAGECTACHTFEGKGDATTVRLAGGATAASTGVLCVTCHEEVGKAANGPGGHGPAATGECGSCHRPHGSDHPSLLSTPEAELCTTCHDDVAGQLKLANVHKPATAACSLCHNPHGSGNPAKAREAVNTLCLACHAMSARPAGAAGQESTLFGRPVREALAGLLSPQARIALDPLRRRNHPVMGHPVTGPKDPLDVSRPFNCVSCHGPHGTEAPGLKRFAGDDPSGFCVKCHK
jgi:predicted CXXCH cytochrome family protein